MSVIDSDDTRPYRVRYFTVVNGELYEKIIDFERKRDYTEWNGMECFIKFCIAHINEESGDGTMTSLHVQRLRQWIKITDAFTDRFGKARVPLDMRIAIHSVEHNFRQLTDFGPDVGCGVYNGTDVDFSYGFIDE